MSNVSNESIWGKLSEMDKKMDKILWDQESQNRNKQEVETNQVQSMLKEEQIDKIVYKYTNALNKVMINMFNFQWRKQDIVSKKLNRIRKRPHLIIKKFRFNLSSILIASLTVFGVLSALINFMQCNSYNELKVEYRNKVLVIGNLQSELDSLKVKMIPLTIDKTKKKKR